MADSSFSVDTDGLANAVPELVDVANHLNALGNDLRTQLDSLGKPWGDDKPGQAFFKEYGPAVDQVQEGVKSMVDALQGVIDGVTTMSKGFQNVEETAKARLHDLTTNMGDGSSGSGGSSGTFSAASVGRISEISATPTNQSVSMSPATFRVGTVVPGGSASGGSGDGEAALSPTTYEAGSEIPASAVSGGSGSMSASVKRALPRMPAEGVLGGSGDGGGVLLTPAEPMTHTTSEQQPEPTGFAELEPTIHRSAEPAFPAEPVDQ